MFFNIAFTNAACPVSMLTTLIFAVILLLKFRLSTKNCLLEVVKIFQ